MANKIPTDVFAVDINPFFHPTNSPNFFVLNEDAIFSWLQVALVSSVSSSNRIFKPIPGTRLLELLQSPRDSNSAFTIRNEILSRMLEIDSRVSLTDNNIKITPSRDTHGYDVSMKVKILENGKISTLSFLLDA